MNRSCEEQTYTPIEGRNPEKIFMEPICILISASLFAGVGFLVFHAHENNDNDTSLQFKIAIAVVYLVLASAAIGSAVLPEGWTQEAGKWASEAKEKIKERFFADDGSSGMGEKMEFVKDKIVELAWNAKEKVGHAVTIAKDKVKGLADRFVSAVERAFEAIADDLQEAAEAVMEREDEDEEEVERC